MQQDTFDWLTKELAVWARHLRRYNGEHMKYTQTYSDTVYVQTRGALVADYYQQWRECIREMHYRYQTQFTFCYYDYERKGLNDEELTRKENSHV